MRRQKILTTLIALGLTAGACAIEPGNFGIVNFGTCITDSKLGKQEQASFESLKKQMASLLEETEKQLNEISTKFNDPEYLDGLSPEAEEEMKNKFRALSEDLNRYQNQYYQVLNQANMRIVQTMGMQINTAAEKVAKEKRLTMVINKEACFFFNPQLEITPLVISEMDRTYEEEGKKNPLSAAPAQISTPATAETAVAPAAAPAVAKDAVKSETKTASAPTAAVQSEAKTAAAPAPVATPATTPAVKSETKTAEAPAPVATPAVTPAAKSEAKTASAPAPVATPAATPAAKSEAKTASAPAAAKTEAKK